MHVYGDQSEFSCLGYPHPNMMEVNGPDGPGHAPAYWGKQQGVNLSDEYESVEHPSHYGGDTVYEAIKVIHAWGLNFDLGSVIKYISRAGKKPLADEIEDMEKARQYLKFHIKELKNQRKNVGN